MYFNVTFLDSWTIQKLLQPHAFFISFVRSLSLFLANYFILFSALFSSVTANGYQLVVSTSHAQAMTNAQIASISGKLSGFGAEEQVPTIAIITHYDAFAVAPVNLFPPCIDLYSLNGYEY